MIVGLDIDGVVADFLSPFLCFVEKKICNGPIAIESITDLSFKEHAFLTEKAVWGCMTEVSYDPAFWNDLRSLVLREEWQALEELSSQGKLVFLTHRYERETYSIHDVTCDWLKLHGISKPIVHFTQEPKARLVQELGVGLFVDDRHENCQDVAENTQAKVFMLHRLYNQSFSHPRVTRIQNLNELFNYVR